MRLVAALNPELAAGFLNDVNAIGAVLLSSLHHP
jgi:hypothetical protein